MSQCKIEITSTALDYNVNSAVAERPRHALSVEILSIAARLYEQVAQLLMTNPRDALHHGKRQSFKTITTPRLWVICHPVAGIDIAYLCTKFYEMFGNIRCPILSNSTLHLCAGA